jgi:hypothetical protein
MMVEPFESRIITLGDIKYLRGPFPVGSIHGRYVTTNSGVLPVTVLDARVKISIGSLDVKSGIQALIENDDVMTTFFTNRIMFMVSPGPEPVVLDNGHPSLRDPQFQTSLPCPGPYFLLRSELYQVFKLYEDSYNTFVCGLEYAVSDKPR